MKIHHKLPLQLLLFLLPVCAAAQTHKVSTTALYYADANTSPKEAKLLAIERARIEAIANKFGTLITQDVYSQISNKDNSFMQLSTAELKGEWVKDLAQPQVRLIETTADDIYVYEAKVKGLIRALKNNAPEFETLMLRNAANKQNADTNFREGDRFYLYFKAPTDGYVAAFLIDDHQKVFCLLPHENAVDGLLRVKHDSEYYFFSKNHDPEYLYNDGMEVTCDAQQFEINRVYVIFSPNPFIRPTLAETPRKLKSGLILPSKLSLKEFVQWMNRVYGRDKDMSRKVMRIKINKNKK